MISNNYVLWWMETKRNSIDLINTIVKSFAQLIWYRFAKWNFKFNHYQPCRTRRWSKIRECKRKQAIWQSIKNLINKLTNMTSYPATHTRQVTSQKRWDVVYDYRGSACCSGPGYCYKLKECGGNGCKDTSPYHFIMKSTSKRRSR